MLIVLSKMLVVGHKFGVQGKFKSIHIPPKISHFSQKSGHALSGLKVASLQKVALYYGCRHWNEHPAVKNALFYSTFEVLTVHMHVDVANIFNFKNFTKCLSTCTCCK